MKKSSNQSLNSAKSAKQDEFYTQLGDIEKELKHYAAQLQGKVILCNCDDPFESNFIKYFTLNFNALGIKKLIATGISCEGYMVEIDGGGIYNARQLKGDGIYGAGDFRSDESIQLLKQADIVVTNPPFSLFREYVAQLVAHDKKFLIIGAKSAITYSGVFPLIKSNKLRVGVRAFSSGMWFVPGDPSEHGKIVDGVKLVSIPAIWFTNLDHARHREKITLSKKYTPTEYPKYDNYDAIEVGKVADIPADYDGVMGVPITFLDKYNPEQFEIVGATESEGKGFSNGLWRGSVAQAVVNGKRVYKRLFVKRVDDTVNMA